LAVREDKKVCNLPSTTSGDPAGAVVGRRADGGGTEQPLVAGVQVEELV